MKVVLDDIEAMALEDTTHALLASGADAHAVVTDGAKPDQVHELARQTLNKYVAVHVPRNNAGIIVGSAGPAWMVPCDDWWSTMDVNLIGVVHRIQSFLPMLIEVHRKPT